MNVINNFLGRGQPSARWQARMVGLPEQLPEMQALARDYTAAQHWPPTMCRAPAVSPVHSYTFDIQELGVGDHKVPAYIAAAAGLLVVANEAGMEATLRALPDCPGQPRVGFVTGCTAGRADRCRWQERPVRGGVKWACATHARSLPFRGLEQYLEKAAAWPPVPAARPAAAVPAAVAVPAAAAPASSAEGDLSDAELLEQFAARALPLERWDHQTRLRVVWLHLQRDGLAACLEPTGALCTAWRAYKESVGHGAQWNTTLTLFWARLVQFAASKHPPAAAGAPGFAAFWAQNRYLHSGSLFELYYSHAVLFSDRARTEWVEPDLAPLPGPRPSAEAPELTDDELLRQFEACSLPIAEWTHRNRLRTVYLALARRGLADCTAPGGWLGTAWHRYKDSCGHGHLWNATLTGFWCRLVWHTAQRHAAGAACCGRPFDEFYAHSRHLHSGSLWQLYYSEALLFSEPAKQGFVAPDLAALPGIAGN